MGFLDRLLGRTHDESQYHGVPGKPGAPSARAGEAPGKHGYAPGDGQRPAADPGRPAATAATGTGDPDEVAIERYRYLLRTAPPDAVEQAHAEAFEKLTPEQRRRVLEDLGSALPPAERATSDDPRSLARMATRAELRNPGTLEQSFRGGPGTQGAPARQGPGFGSMMGSSLLGTVAGVVIGSAVANMLFGSAFGDPSQDFAADDAGASAGDGGAGTDAGDGGGADAGDAGTVEAAGDGGFGDFGGGDGGFGDFGGGDFGGF